MNSTTKMLADQILKQRYYRDGQSLGSGGWSYLRERGINEWKKYRLIDYETGFFEVTETITAKDDGAAVAAFSSLYRLSSFPDGYCIEEVIISYRIVTEVLK